MSCLRFTVTVVCVPHMLYSYDGGCVIYEGTGVLRDGLETLDVETLTTIELIQLDFLVSV